LDIMKYVFLSLICIRVKAFRITPLIVIKHIFHYNIPRTKAVGYSCIYK